MFICTTVRQYSSYAQGTTQIRNLFHSPSPRFRPTPLSPLSNYRQCCRQHSFPPFLPLGNMSCLKHVMPDLPWTDGHASLPRTPHAVSNTPNTRSHFGHHLRQFKRCLPLAIPSPHRYCTKRLRVTTDGQPNNASVHAHGEGKRYCSSGFT